MNLPPSDSASRDVSSRSSTPAPSADAPALLPGRTIWHITFGTYGRRLHGANEPTVDRQHNQTGAAFLPVDPIRHEREEKSMRGSAVRLSASQRAVIEALMPAICQRGQWDYLVCAAPGPPDDDHVHSLLGADPSVHGKRIREWLKRWLTEELDQRWGRPEGGSWWAVGGSTRAIKDACYLRNAYLYIGRQRTTPWVNRLPGV
ncbi:MAG: hypothetical protein IT440_04650 [Phycisphaeraceae bacterium]|nr:hypothetical protein [Phycisphaeraceae bacterium]